MNYVKHCPGNAHGKTICSPQPNVKTCPLQQLMPPLYNQMLEKKNPESTELCHTVSHFLREIVERQNNKSTNSSHTNAEKYIR